MSKNIGIITGATGGLGKEFVKQIMTYQLDEVWCIARNQEKLNELALNYGSTIRTIPLDLSKEKEINILADYLTKDNYLVKYLVNNASVAKMGRYDDFTQDELSMTIDLNCKAVVLVTQIVLGYMRKGSHIINVSSQSSFQPVAYINLYASTKAFEKNYSRALNVELKDRGITSLACCPGWVDTEMLYKEYNGHKTKFKGLVKASKVVKKAYHDANRNKDMSVFSLYVKSMHFMAKLLPHKWVMATWVRSIRKYLVK